MGEQSFYFIITEVTVFLQILPYNGNFLPLVRVLQETVCIGVCVSYMKTDTSK